MSGFSASPAQRAKVRELGCVWCGMPGCDPAHLLPRGLVGEGQDDPLAVVALCRREHRLYDAGELDLYPAVKDTPEYAFAVARVGEQAARWRVSNQRPEKREGPPT